VLIRTPMTTRPVTPAKPVTPATPVTPSWPVSLEIPILDVHAAVIPVSTHGGELDVPANPAQVGWWTGSALPGATGGSIVIDGHVDSAATGPGALFRLTNLRTGDQILVTTATGQRRSYAVIGRRVYVKAAGLPPTLFARNGPPQLLLITCGGPFDRNALSYLDNVVIFAGPQ
jgi:sortase (surface protein transpeptidase)